MHKSTYKIDTYKSIQQLTVMAMILTYMIVVKIAFNKLAGIELITFSFIIISLYLPLKKSIFISATFYLLVIVLEGFHLAQIPYPIIFSLVVILSKLTWKIGSSKTVWLIASILSPLITTLIYFGWDAVLFGYEFALANVYSALPIAMISMITITIAISIIFPAIKKILDLNLGSLGEQKMKTKKSLVICCASILMPLGIINSDIISTSQSQLKEPSNYIQPNNRMLDVNEYNSLVSEMSDDEIMFNIIFNENDDVNGKPISYKYKFKGLNKLNSNYLYDVIKHLNEDESSPLKFNYKDNFGIGISLRNFTWNGVEFGNDSYCGFSYIGDKSSSLGVSLMKVQPKTIYTFDYHIKDKFLGTLCRF